ncbi:MAG: 2-amino-4-hydroxy-6-hydroxymethyldihydropteridine diphosphokinase [Actinomycetota bacterium]|nr:2-amino-4-hydroxy-6-hydroxymethyldihydropteridine diphosphokinase [Actinomycetota bacterium]
MRAFLALGSNLGDRWAHLRRAARAMPDVTRISPVYETEPVGGPAGQGRFLNAVVELETDLGPRELLAVCRRLEEAAGRVRRQHHGPRTLDVDVLLVGDPAEDHTTVDEPDLTVPHPRMWERPFVLIPLADLAPDLVPDPPVDPSVRAVGRL